MTTPVKIKILQQLEEEEEKTEKKNTNTFKIKNGKKTFVIYLTKLQTKRKMMTNNVNN